MPLDFSAYDRYVEQNFAPMVEELRAFCATPTLAGQHVGVAEGVEVVRGLLEPVGARVEVVPIGAAPPVLIAELGAGQRTLLLYNHYDVQPPEPLDEWVSPPYGGEVREGRFYARGAADNRGDLLSRVLAIRAYLQTVGDLPLRVRWLIEGEEEVGSPHIGPVIEDHAEKLRADWCAWEGAGRDVRGRPQVVCGLKGMLYVELHAKGPNRDAHSAVGGILPNPAWRLVTALATLRDEKGNFLMDGLDELVDAPSAEDMRAADAMPHNDEERRALYGIKEWQRGLRGHEVLREEMFRPTANIAGFNSGYGGEGSKTIVPRSAVVKMDFRLVPRQTPENMLELLRAHLDRRGYSDIKIVQLGGVNAAKTPVDHPLVKASVQAWQSLGDDEVNVAPMSGGSGPMAYISSLLGIPTVMNGGVGDANARAHSPNESISLEHFKGGIRYWGRFFALAAEG